MTNLWRRLVLVKPGEERRLSTLLAVGLAYGAAVGLGEILAQSIFVERCGAARLASMFLLKGVFDVAASVLYLPLTRGRSARRVLDFALMIYAVTMIAGRLLLAAPGRAPAYALYLGHECAWTILTIHWGIYVLDLFNAEEARRLFPLVFTATGIGKIASGMAAAHLAATLGALDLLWATAAVAGAGIVATTSFRLDQAGEHTNSVQAPEADLREAVPLDGLFRSWRTSWASPLARSIALSTAAMVFLRYGLKLLALDALGSQLANNQERIATFIGHYTVWASAASIIVGILITPRLLALLGVGFVNVVYAVATVASYGLLLAAPSTVAAVAALFVKDELKDAIKTPLSALFYGAERPDRRAQVRAFVFGTVIPAATVASSLAFEVATRGHGTGPLIIAGLVVAVTFVAASLGQNRAWRHCLRELLAWKLETSPVANAPPCPDELAPHAAHDPVCLLAWRGLASTEPRLRAVAEEVLAEAVPRPLARRLAACIPTQNPAAFE